MSLIKRLATLVTVSDLATLALGIEKAVALSVRDHPQRAGGCTQTEIKRRATWCVDMSLTLLRDQGWSSERVVDNIGTALGAYLENGSWFPNESSPVRMWAPDGG